MTVLNRQYIAGSLLKLLLIGCFCAFVLCEIGQAQGQQSPDLSTIKRQIDVLEKQQQLILDKLNELAPVNAIDARSLPTVTEVRGEGFKGEMSAKIAIIEYGDFECPFCAEFGRETFPQILKNYIQTGKVRYLYRDLPLHHPHAMAAARASRCAEDQGKYWEMHDALFASQGNLVDAHLSELAGSLGLDATKFTACLASDKFTDRIQASVSQAGKLGITGTPSFIIGTLESGSTVRIEKRIVGAMPYELFRADLDELLGGDSREATSPTAVKFGLTPPQ